MGLFPLDKAILFFLVFSEVLTLLCVFRKNKNDYFIINLARLNVFLHF